VDGFLVREEREKRLGWRNCRGRSSKGTEQTRVPATLVRKGRLGKQKQFENEGEKKGGRILAVGFLLLPALFPQFLGRTF
jgi:hypothetical protein